MEATRKFGRKRLSPRWAVTGLIALCCLPVLAGLAGVVIGPSLVHPANLNPMRFEAANEMLRRTGAVREDFAVRASDGAELRGWKIRARGSRGDWVILLHGVSDNRTGVLGQADFLLRHGYSVVMMDARGHGESGGTVVTYGWKERHDVVDVVNALYRTERVRHLGALGESMGAAVALQAAAIEPRIEGVVAEDAFADLREVSYDYAGLDWSPLLGRTVFLPATIFALHGLGAAGQFQPDNVSPKEAVATRPFPVLLICGTEDHRIPCRHAESIFQSATGPKDLWIVEGAGHTMALGKAPAEYEARVTGFFTRTFQVVEGDVGQASRTAQIE